ncbi:hypothetical protein FQN50_000090 [Emmonsiellopsis sp. PD_5]|nr:hypothetical protein FQN50_000090 [Emmonsiellopsis sp. PD_5]
MPAEILALIGLGLTAPGVIDVFVRAGKYIISQAQGDKKARAHASDLEAFFGPSYIQRLDVHMRLAQNLLHDPTVDERDKTRLVDIFENIKSTFSAMNESITTILGENKLLSSKRRAAREELGLQTARCKELLGDFRERVMALRDLRATDSDMYLGENDFQWIVSDRPPQTVNPNAFVRKGRVSREMRGVIPEVRWFLYETRPYSFVNKESVKTNIRILSQKLDAAEKVEPGILPILGFRDDAENQEFQLVFIMPEEQDRAETLANVMQMETKVPSLNCRVELCLQLAESILHIHGVRLVHKSIRPDNIILLPMSEKQNDQNQDWTEMQDEQPEPRFKLFLLGWQYARTADSFSTQRTGEKLWQRRIYQHPERQHWEAEADYSMGHDIYSLGACMLEILIWMPLVMQASTDLEAEDAELSSKFVQIFQSLEAQDSGNGNITMIDPRKTEDIRRVMQNPRKVQRVLLSLARRELPSIAGKRLGGVVSDCLGYLDKKNGGTIHGSSTSHREAGNDFAENILKSLRVVFDEL